MATQLMIYQNPVPVSYARHGHWSVEKGMDYAFCRNVNAVPLMVTEFANAALEYSIVFTGNGDVVMPVAILGVRADDNLYINQQGTWQAKYIPAFVRRYPFGFASDDNGGTFALCIDEAFSGCNQSGRGERLFDDEKRPTAFVEKVLKFAQQFQVQTERTKVFCKKLKDLNLLKSMQARIDLGSGERIALDGFSVVDRARLKTVSVDVLAELSRSDVLESIYAHIVSLQNLATLRDRVSDWKMPSKRGNGVGQSASAPN